MKSHKIYEDDTGMSSPSLMCHPQASHVSPYSPHGLHVVPKPPMLSPNLPCHPCCPHVIPKPPILSPCHPQASRNYRPQCSCGKVMFLHLSVSHSVHGGGGVWQTTPWADTPTPNPVHAGIHAPLPAATAADGTHPTGMLSCFNNILLI